MKWCNCSK